jgi:hypothetical protein
MNQKVKLRDGKVIKVNDDHMTFKPYQEMYGKKEDPYACKICPIYEVCQGNNEFDCEVYGMFSGGSFMLDDLIEVCEDARKWRLQNDIQNKTH